MTKLYKSHYKYRKVERRWWQVWPFHTGVEFWDVRTGKWRESAMSLQELEEVAADE